MSRTIKRSPEKEVLLRSLETTRRQLSGDIGEVGGRLNMSRRFRQAVSENSVKWIGGGVVAGVLLAILSPGRFRRSKKEKAARGVVGSVFLGLLGVATKQILRSSLPSLQKVAQDGLQQWLAARYGNVEETVEPSVKDKPQF